MTGEKIQARDGWALFGMIAVVAGLLWCFSGERSSASPPPPQVVYRDREPAHVAVTPAPVQSEPRIIYVNSPQQSPPAVNINNVVHLGSERDVPIAVKQGSEQPQTQPHTNTVNYSRRDPRCEASMVEYNRFLAEHEQRRAQVLIDQR